MFKLLSVTLLLGLINSAILLYHLQLVQTHTTFTLPYTEPFITTPIFSFYIESASVYSTQFSLIYNSATTSVTTTQITIQFQVLRSSAFLASENIKIALLLTDQTSSYFSIGLKKVTLSSSVNIPFDVSLSSNSIIQIYSLSYPCLWTKSVSTHNIQLAITKFATSYPSNALFSYIYYSNIFVGQKVVALFQQITQTVYDYIIPYQNFAYTPSADNVMFALKAYDSSTVPYMKNNIVADYTKVIGAFSQLEIGYTFPNGVPSTFLTDVFLFNTSFAGCSQGFYLYYTVLFETMPYNCIACNSLCAWCAANSASSPIVSTVDNCLACVYLRYLNDTGTGMGNCVCYPGLQQINNVCQSCQADCLQFIVTYIQSTKQSLFLLSYSFGDAIEQIPIQSNLVTFVNNEVVPFTANQQENAVYIISIALADMAPCQPHTCEVTFLYNYPQKILKLDKSKSLGINNRTVSVSNFVNYYSKIPAQLKEVFTVMSYIIAGTYSGGYTSVVKILFQLQQLIQAHKYLNLTLPVVFNQFLNSLLSFRFMDLTNLLPKQVSASIQNLVPSDLDNIGPPKLMYYQNGLNFYKNSIGSLLSTFTMLFLNVCLYWFFKLLPFKPFKKLAKKMSIRKMITIHDTLEQLQFPIFYFALNQFQIIILHPDLIWIYGLALILSSFALLIPFLMVVYIHQHRDKIDRVQIYEDLMQDNCMRQSITYIYYVFNYYRKLFFALCLTYWMPGLIQLYLLLTLNLVHLAFQIYLVVSKTYRSKMKVIIRFINSICIVALQILILVYNLNSQDSPSMINIGFACLYLALTTTLMGILDFIIKIIDTALQEIRKKQKIGSQLNIPKINVLPQFRKQIMCNLGQQLKTTKKDPKQLKFQQDKQLMENTFQNGVDDQSQVMSIRFPDNSHTHVDSNDLIFIDDEWIDVYPPYLVKDARSCPLPKSQFDVFDQRRIYELELYEIDEQTDKKAISKTKVERKRKRNKIQYNQNQTYNSNNIFINNSRDQTNTLKLKKTDSKILQIKKTMQEPQDFISQIHEQNQEQS